MWRADRLEMINEPIDPIEFHYQLPLGVHISDYSTCQEPYILGGAPREAQEALDEGPPHLEDFR